MLSQKILSGKEQISLCPSVHRSWSLFMHRSTSLRNSINAGLWRALQDWHGNQHRDRLSCILSPHLIPRRNSRLPNGTRLEEGTKSFGQPLADIYGSTKTNTQKHKKSYPTLNHKSSECLLDRESKLS